VSSVRAAAMRRRSVGRERPVGRGTDIG